jgi:hypothetical protein
MGRDERSPPLPRVDVLSSDPDLDVHYGYLIAGKIIKLYYVIFAHGRSNSRPGS